MKIKVLMVLCTVFLMACQTMGVTPELALRDISTSLNAPNPEIPFDVLVPFVEVKWIAGDKYRGTRTGPAEVARFRGVSEFLSLPNGDLLIADAANKQLRLLSKETHEVTTVLNEEQQSIIKAISDSGIDKMILLSDTEILLRVDYKRIILKYNLKTQNLTPFLIDKKYLESGKTQNMFSTDFEFIHSGYGGPYSCLSSVKGVVYFCENNQIFQISKANEIKVFLGRSACSNHLPPPFDYFQDGSTEEACFWGPSDIAFTPSQDAYISDKENQRLRYFDAQKNQVTSVFGSPTALGFTDLLGGFQDGKLSEANLSSPQGLFWLEKPSALVFEANGALRLLYENHVYTLLQNFVGFAQDYQNPELFYLNDNKTSRIYQLSLNLDALLPYLKENNPILISKEKGEQLTAMDFEERAGGAF